MSPSPELRFNISELLLIKFVARCFWSSAWWLGDTTVINDSDTAHVRGTHKVLKATIITKLTKQLIIANEGLGKVLKDGADDLELSGPVIVTISTLKEMFYMAELKFDFKAKLY